MGAGNYLPNASECYPQIAEIDGNDPVYEMVYVDSSYKSEDLDQEDIRNNQSNFEVELQDHIVKLLPRSFERRGEWTFENQVLAVHLNGEYQGIYYPIIVTPLHPLGIKHMDSVARRLFDGLAAHYSLSVRSGPWTSGRYVPTNALSSAGN